VTDVVGLDFGQIDDTDLDVQAGGFDRNVTSPMVVSVDKATGIDAGIGDVLTVEFANGSRAETTIVGLFDDQSVLTGDYLVDTSVLADAGVPQTAEWLAVSIADGASPADVDALVARLSDEFPYASVETATEFRQRLEGKVDKVLTMVNVMVALAVIIALIGIANTLALSVHERRREIGLLRAVGMSRQLRRMVRFEAALVGDVRATSASGSACSSASAQWALPASVASGVRSDRPDRRRAGRRRRRRGRRLAPCTPTARLDVLDAIAR
jgi:ABC-type antimicrobial peptide transport system permease subunit